MHSSASKIKIFADGANLETIIALNANPIIEGITTNPTLIRKAGVRNYKDFANQLLSVVTSKPVSLEVLSDEFKDMIREAQIIASWGSNVFVKIPITNTHGESTAPVVNQLVQEGIKVNVTAIMTLSQVDDISKVIRSEVPSFLSIFAGRIADAGQDPIPLVKEIIGFVAEKDLKSEIIWASPREVLNVVQAQEIGCHIITITEDIFSKLPLLGKSLTQFSLETVQMFYTDAKKSGLTI